MKSNVALLHAMQAYGRWRGTDFLNFFLGSRRWWAITTPPWRGPYMYWIGGMVGPSVGLDNLKKRKFYILLLSVVELRLLGCSARSLATIPTELFTLTLLGLLAYFWSCVFDPWRQKSWWSEKHLWFFFFIFVPCILICIKFIHQQMHCLLNLIKF